MTHLESLRREIKDKSAVLGVIGLGYVGLAVSAVFAEAGFQVIGVDLDAERVRVINNGDNPIQGREPGLASLIEQVTEAGRLWATTEHAQLVEADVILIAVETPIDDAHKPDYSALTSALRSAGEAMKPSTLIIVESTVAPGTTDGLARRVLEESSGYRVDEDFYLGHCPERVMPGRLIANLRGVSRVCGGHTPETAEIMVDLYSHVVEADLDPADCVTAELVKTAENAYRDVNIAFANELALICEGSGGDVWKVRELVNKSPGRNVLYPGAGVGGHCIPKDPWLLVAGATDRGLPVRLISAARQVNDWMPKHVAGLAMRAIDDAGIRLSDANVLVLGYAYREDTDDVRNSPSLELVQQLREEGLEVVIHDPWVEQFAWDLSEIDDFDIVILMVGHEEYKDLDPLTWNVEAIVDGRGSWHELAGRGDAPFKYFGLGIGRT